MCPVSYNEFVKRPGVECEYTQEMITELRKCKDDIMYFLKYVKIVTIDKGRVPFVPYPFQIEMLELFQENRLVISTICRQSGKTTICAIYALWYALFHEDKYVGIASNKAASAKDILSRIKLIYEELPDWLKCGVDNYAVMSIKFENGSEIVSVATSPDAFRGRSCALMLLDELAFIRNNLAQEFWMANYPAISSSNTSRLLIVSTPNGIGNLFHDLFSNAELGKNGFIAFRADYTCVPGRDENWYNEQVKNLGETKALQELKCQFLGSTNTIVNTKALESLLKNTKEPLHFQLNDKLRIYEDCIPHAVYIIGTDVAKGSGEHDSVLQIARVISLKPVKLKHVAVFQDNFTDTYKYADIIFRLATYYNNAFTVIENNSEGDGVIKRLYYEYEYENIVSEGGTLDKLGVRATKKTKPRAVLLMKKLLEEDSFELYDEKTIKQLASFVDDNGKMHGNDDAPDDLVSALYWCCYTLTFDLFDESSEIPQAKEAEDDVWGIIGDDDKDSIENFWT